MTGTERTPVRWQMAVRRAWHGFMRHDGIDSAAALTFFALLALLPGSLALVSVFAILDDRDRAVDDLAAVLDTVLPDQATRDLEGLLRELLSLNNPYVALTIALLLLIWTTSGYATAFGRATNKVFEVEEGRPFWAFRGRMILVALLLDLLGAIVITVLFGPGDWPVWAVLRWPVLLAFAVLFVAVLYTFTPNVVRPQRRWVSVGSSFAILFWIVVTGGVALYAVFVDHGAVYGSLGGVIVGLLWLYATNAALVAGVELDAEITRLQQIAEGEDVARSLDLPVRDTRRIRMLRRQRNADIAAARELQNDAKGRAARGGRG
ncbi:YihY/virulence factor BrkB family protein [Pseudolysinimonas sp.]|jgi:membrane protein|uniref:YihY/virulence factor BrkB family protein n=1 Tax=Pseudolysinimonas sp. TaxID=2680009 RepID=UPI0037852DC7